MIKYSDLSYYLMCVSCCFSIHQIGNFLLNFKILFVLYQCRIKTKQKPNKLNSYLRSQQQNYYNIWTSTNWEKIRNKFRKENLLTEIISNLLHLKVIKNKIMPLTPYLAVHFKCFRPWPHQRMLVSYTSIKYNVSFLLLHKFQSHHSESNESTIEKIKKLYLICLENFLYFNSNLDYEVYIFIQIILILTPNIMNEKHIYISLISALDQQQ